MKTIIKPLLSLLLLFFGCQTQHISNPASTYPDTLQVDSLGEDAPFIMHDGWYFYQNVSFNGLQIGEIYTKQEIIKLIGAPDLISDYSKSTMEEHGYSEQWYKYPNSFFIFRDNRLDQFEINDSSLLIDGEIRVGQDTSVLRRRYRHIEKRSHDVFFLWYANDPIVFESVNGRISSIRYVPAV